MIFSFTSSYLKRPLLLLIGLLLLSQFIHCQQQQQIEGRISPGCALANDYIYCYGGFFGSPNNISIGFSSSINDNIALDLSIFGDLFNTTTTAFDKTKVNWSSKSKLINGNTEIPSVGRVATTPLSDGSLLFYGGYFGGTGNGTPNDMPFLHFNPQTNSWNSIAIPNNTYYTHTDIINIGRDRIWIYGGLRPNNNIRTSTFYIYDFTIDQWSVIQPAEPAFSIDHTATLVGNLIYIIGGQQSSSTNQAQLFPFNRFQTYNTLSGSWNNITASGANPESRRFHSTVLTSDEKYLLIYGGMRYNDRGYLSYPNTDVYYVYDIKNNNLQYVSLGGGSQLSTSTRYGHYAAIYKTNYLLLVFGMSDFNVTSDSLNILNVKDVYKPTWLEVPSDQGANSNSDDTKKKIIPAVVASVVGALAIAGAIGLFIFIRNRKRRQKKAFQLVQEDPRNNNTYDMDLIAKRPHDMHTEDQSVTAVGSTYDPPIHAQHNEQIQHGKLNQGEIADSVRHDTVKPSESNHVKPFESNFIKPSGNN
ncbi:unnamed protein product [Cunninghamella blakesleeana]